jgi:hypothetical protein
MLRYVTFRSAATLLSPVAAAVGIDCTTGMILLYGAESFDG